MPRRGLAALGPISPASPAGFLLSEISARRGCSLLPAGSVPWVAGRGARSGPLRGARVHVCEAAEKRARQELKARRQKAAGRPRLFHAPSLFPMKLCLASPFKFPPPFETLRMRSPSPFPGGPRRCVCVRAVHAGRAEGAAPFAVRARALGGEKEPPTARRAARRPSELPRARGQVAPQVTRCRRTEADSVLTCASSRHLPPGGSVAAK